jgi:type I restriction enzyme S subunit
LALVQVIETEEFNVPILSNGIGGKSLYGWTDKAKINQPSLTISARGTIGWTSFRDTPFFPIVRLLVLCQVKYLNNIIEQDHRFIKKITKPMMGFKAFHSAQATIAGIPKTNRDSVAILGDF